MWLFSSPVQCWNFVCAGLYGAMQRHNASRSMAFLIIFNCIRAAARQITAARSSATLEKGPELADFVDKAPSKATRPEWSTRAARRTRCLRTQSGARASYSLLLNARYADATHAAP